MNEPAPFPWEAAMAFAFRVLRWTPDDFWRATPRELAAAMGDLAPPPARRLDLDALMRAYPDGLPSGKGRG